MSLSKLVKDNFVDTTAKMVVANPAFGFVENVVMGFSDTFTLDARVDGTLAKYAGIGYAYALLRDYLHKKLKIDPTTFGGKTFDALYSGGYLSAVAAGIYAWIGAPPEQILEGSFLIGVTGVIAGGPMGYSLDVFRDLCGTKESERSPNWVRKLGRKAKLGLAATIMAASVGLVGGILHVTPHNYRGLIEDVKAEIHEYRTETPQNL